MSKRLFIVQAIVALTEVRIFLTLFNNVKFHNLTITLND